MASDMKPNGSLVSIENPAISNQFSVGVGWGATSSVQDKAIISTEDAPDNEPSNAGGESAKGGGKGGKGGKGKKGKSKTSTADPNDPPRRNPTSARPARQKEEPKEDDDEEASGMDPTASTTSNKMSAHGSVTSAMSGVSQQEDGEKNRKVVIDFKKHRGLHLTVCALFAWNIMLTVVLTGQRVWDITEDQITLQRRSMKIDGDLEIYGNLLVLPSPIEPEEGKGNVVVGEGHTYSQAMGSLVAGKGNTVSGRGANVLGGMGNIASGNHATVTGGTNNRAIGEYSSVSGGSSNEARGRGSSVAGGENQVVETDYGFGPDPSFSEPPQQAPSVPSPALRGL